MNWLLIGSSPSVTTYLPRARQECRIDRTITCNAGIELEWNPDIYVAVDHVTMERWKDQMREAQKHGTRLVTLNYIPATRTKRDCDWYDEFLDLGDGEPTRDKWGKFRYAGPLCLEYACRHGATSVVLVGCDGYTDDGPEHQYFDGFQTRKHVGQGVWQRCTVEVLQPGFQAVCNVFPHVRFIQYGDPCYAIRGENWSVRGNGIGSLEDTE